MEIPSPKKAEQQFVYHLGRYFPEGVQVVEKRPVGPSDVEVHIRCGRAGLLRIAQSSISEASILGRVSREAAIHAAAVLGVPVEEIAPEVFDEIAERDFRTADRVRGAKHQHAAGLEPEPTFSPDPDKVIHPVIEHGVTHGELGYDEGGEPERPRGEDPIEVKTDAATPKPRGGRARGKGRERGTRGGN